MGGMLLAVFLGSLASACGNGDACGCLCSAPADGSLIAPCSTSTSVDFDAAMTDDATMADDAE